MIGNKTQEQGQGEEVAGILFGGHRRVSGDHRHQPGGVGLARRLHAFQRKALTLPKSWRLNYPKARKKGVNCYSPHTVLRWSRAFRRRLSGRTSTAGRSASGGRRQRQAADHQSLEGVHLDRGRRTSQFASLPPKSLALSWTTLTRSGREYPWPLPQPRHFFGSGAGLASW